MSVIVLQVFVSLMLVAGALMLLAYSVRHADYEHADRLSLLPLDADTATCPHPMAPPAEDRSHDE